MGKHLKKALLFFILSITISTICFSRSFLLKPLIPQHNTPIKSEINSVIANTSVPFIKNEGQTDKGVSFYASTQHGTIFVTRKNEIVYSLDGIKENETNEYKTVALKETLVNTNAPFVHGEDLSETKVNILLGDDSSKWKNNIPSYNTISLGELHKGIEVKLRAYNNNVEKLFYISSKGNVKDIKIKISGADTLTLGEEGELLANTSLGAVAFTKPIAYQEINGKKTYVEVKYTVNKDIYAFDVESYDKNIPLVIDPLLASTFIGGSDSDYVYDVVLDTSNNAYIVGYTNSFSYPTTTGVYQSAKTGGYDVFVSKFNNDLSALSASTFIGGSGTDRAYAIALDSSYNVYIAGYTNSTNYPTINAYQTANNGNYDAFISKLSNDLSTLLSSTYVGSSSYDYAYGIALDSLDNIYITGYTNSINYPTAAGVYQTANSGGYDVFVSKFNSDLSALSASTFIGGSGSDNAFKIALNSSGNLYIAGYTDSSDYPVTANAYQSERKGLTDVFVSQLTNDLKVLSSSTYIGGSNNDRAYAIALNSSNNVYITGETYSSDYPTTTNVYQPGNNGGYDVFVSKLSDDLSTLLSSTYIGGSSHDYAYSIALNSENNVYITGKTLSANYPTTDRAYETEFNGSSDVFISKLNNDLSALSASTFIGGATDEEARAIVIDSSGNIYATGFTNSSDYPTTSGAYQINNNGVYDAFVCKFNSDLAADTYTITATAGSNGTITPSGDITVNYGDSQTFTITPDTGYHISDVLVDGTSVGDVETYTFNSVTSNHTISAMFAIDIYALDVTVIGSGSVTKDPDQVSYDYNTVVTLAATPDTGWHFVGWSGDAMGTDNPLTVTMNADKNITALFEINTYTITASVSGTNGTVSPLVQTVNYGSNASVIITPDTGCHIASVTDNGADVTGSVVDNGNDTYTYTTAAVIENHDVVVMFAINTFTITATANSNGSMSPSGSITVNYGDSQTFIITADIGYMINQVIVDGSLIKPIRKTYTFNNVISNHTITATFVKIPDTTPPTLTLSGVDLNVTTITSSSFFSFGLIATDSPESIARTVVKNNGITIKDIMGLPIINDSVITLFEGINDIEVTVYDASGNFTTKSFRVISDTKPPVVKLNKILESVSSNALNITGTIFDTGTGIKEVKINGKTMVLPLSGKLNTTCTLTQGKNIITVQVTDKAENTVTETYVVNYTAATLMKIITLQINNPEITINGISKTIDEQGSKPVIKNDRTLLPIRALIESLDGHITWNEETREVTINLNYHTIILTIDNNTAVVDGIKMQIDPNNGKVTPIIINGRTYLPLRFIVEHLDGVVDWDNDTRTVIIYCWP
ncbi:MAG: SBBP repeat-containing protein [Caldisericota bacterium]|nr:SBBP repeat-containing protein [Caldisericota bacterium]